MVVHRTTQEFRPPMGTLRTILRRTFYAAAAVSSLLLLATLILWPVSHYRGLYAGYCTAGGDEYYVAADGGRAVVAYTFGLASARGWDFVANPPELSHWSYLSWNTPDPELAPNFAAPTFLGVCWFHTLPRVSWTEHGALIPFSYFTLLFSILPLLALRSIRRRRKAARIGLCPKCRYDLRTQQSGAAGLLCPECGTPVATRPKFSAGRPGLE